MEKSKGTSKVDEIYTGHKPIPMNIAIKVMKSICKITIKEKNGNISYGTGFFMNISNSLKYLVTNYHVINPTIINNKIELEIWNQEKMKLNLAEPNRNIKYFEKPKDITVIEINNGDNIYKDIEFLNYDNNYVNYGYKIYKNVDVFSIQHPCGNNAACASGTIINIYESEFDHNISTDNGSSGCPIILLNNNINLIQVIGIHKNADIETKLNGGTFIGEIFNELNSDNKALNNINNYIIAEIYISDFNVNEDIRIINSYEEVMRGYNDETEIEETEKIIGKANNEEEIKKCEIKINDKLIPFNYFYKFPKKGIYTIKYSFKNALTKTSCLFYYCVKLIKIDLSNFISQKVINMSGMFFGCENLTNVDFTNFNTENVTNMAGIFGLCHYLEYIDLSSFNTQKVTSMECMFWECRHLTNLDLSNFKTQNVTNMRGLFQKCESLTEINLSNFDTKNVTDMRCMFYDCESLNKKDIIAKDNRIFDNKNFEFHWFH